MLPTTGHFKNISCPFYDACICERPYCHFKHTKRETINDANLISELVSKAVHKVLNSNANSSPAESSEKATEATNLSSGIGNIVTYNPTPISELNKYKTYSSTKETSERKSRHIPIQYTPEPPRSFRSIPTTNYSNTFDYGSKSSKSTFPNYSPVQSSPSYVPSSIKILSDNSSSDHDDTSTISQTASETNTHQYVPFNLNSEDSSNTLTAEYNPTKNLSLASITPSNEYVPKYNDEFIDEFLNDPNIYEPTEIITDKNKTKSKEKSDLKTSKLERSSCKAENKSDTKTERSKSKDKSHLSGDERKDSNKKNVSKSPSSSRKPSSTNHSRSTSSSSSHSKNSSKSKLKDKTKDRGKEEKLNNGSEKEIKHNDKKLKSFKSHSKSGKTRDRDKHRKSIRSSEKGGKAVNSSKSSTHKTSEQKIELEELSEDENRGASPIPDDILDDDMGFLSDESDDELEQCKRIFEEYQPPRENVQAKKNVKPEIVEEDNSAHVSARKRVAREKSSNVFRKRTTKPVPVKPAALVMANRYKHVLSNIGDKNQTGCISESSDKAVFSSQFHKRPLVKPVEKTIEDTSQDSSLHTPAKLKRIAHVPNVSSLLNAKRKVEEIAKSKPLFKTPTQTVAKGSKRVAHIPEVAVADIPPVLHSEKSKLPVNVRNRYLFLMVQECVKLYVSRNAAYDRALNEEFNCYSKCTALATYRNSVMLSVNRLRKEAESGVSLSSESSTENSSDFSGKRFYNNIFKWILSEAELLENGYPRPGAQKKGFAIFKEIKIVEKIPEGCQQCVRCKKIYPVDEFGFQVHSEDCIYHPGSRFVFRGETKYICCKESVATTGCCVCSNHVFEIKDPSHLSGFVTTFEPELPDDRKSHAVYALDCEMVYTTRGFELARVTVVDNNCDVVYETLIKPTGFVLDYNTRFSGLTAEMLDQTTTRITEVQATLLLMFNSKTILIGHSLESDLKALRLIHSTVIDTSVVFPHKMGPPKKRGLRGLAIDILKKIIQNNEAGHDSAEDAITCMELIIWKLKEELKLR